MPYWLGFICLFFLFGCSRGDYVSIANVALSKDPAGAAKVLARNKSVHYVSNPEKLAQDLKKLDINIRELFVALVGEAAKEWGAENVEEPEPTKSVKYLQDFQSRVLIDFDAAFVRVETVATKDVQKHLKEAIVIALLMPQDPRQVNLFESGSVMLGDTPYLYEEVMDDQNKPIRWEWRANRYADILLQNGIKTHTIQRNNSPLEVHSVQIPMVKNHMDVRVQKFAPHVRNFAARYKLSPALVYAIIKTESNFNQYAISRSGAVGLMQIMQKTAGKDAYKELTGKEWEPTREYLYDPKNNIELGATYLHILRHRYLAGITNQLSHEYCIISAYNGGAGTVLKAFDSDRKRAAQRINSLSSAEVFRVLREEVAFEETRNYLPKVLNHKKDFIGVK
jgi:membrane-bound lytic murein transglycosylase C